MQTIKGIDLNKVVGAAQVAAGKIYESKLIERVKDLIIQQQSLADKAERLRFEAKLAQDRAIEIGLQIERIAQGSWDDVSIDEQAKQEKV